MAVRSTELQVFGLAKYGAVKLMYHLLQLPQGQMMVQQDSSNVKGAKYSGMYMLCFQKKRRGVQSSSETARTLFCSYNCLHIILVSFRLLVIYIRTSRAFFLRRYLFRENAFYFVAGFGVRYGKADHRRSRLGKHGFLFDAVYFP